MNCLIFISDSLHFFWFFPCRHVVGLHFPSSWWAVWSAVDTQPREVIYVTGAEALTASA